MLQHIEEGSITSVQGISAAGIYCGIKKSRKDLALIVSEVPCNAAGTFTLNKVKAAPIVISQEIVGTPQKIKAILVNSGNANACTGEQGFIDAYESQKYCADKLGIAVNETLISSTGVIGVKMPMKTLKIGIDDIVTQLSTNGGLDAAQAILTTDLRVKSYAFRVQLSTGEVTIGGICKGSGMIMPNMATMLGFIATDASIEKKTLQKLISDAVKYTFNRITVDGDTSTNDMVVILENGLSKITIKEGTEDYKNFSIALKLMCQEMAKSIVIDGEGASKLIQINVLKAKNDEDANLVAKAIANSPLVKTAFNGEDANWGRIISAAGNSGADFDPSKVTILFDDHAVLQPNYNITLDEVKAKAVLSKKDYVLTIDLQAGESTSTWWTCDFSEDYIRINARYRT